MALVEEEEKNVSNVLECNPEDIPSIPEYLEGTSVYGITLLCVGAFAFIIVILLFIDTLRYVIRNSSSNVKSCTASVIAVYPVTCLVCYCAILVPRAYLLSEALTQGMFMAGMYQLFCLFVSYCGGDAELVKLVRPTKLSMKVGPCCCYPCCSLLPVFEVKKMTVKYLKLLVLQLPLVQGLVYFILLVMWAEADSLYQINYMYLQPVIIVSILFGIWSMIMTINLLKPILDPQFILVQKFLVLQMVLLFGKIQGVLTRAILWFDMMACTSAITPKVYAILIHNGLMIIEMVILAFWARNIYKRSIPDIENCQSTNTVTISTVGGINGGNNNTRNSKLGLVNNNNIEAGGYSNITCDITT